MNQRVEPLSAKLAAILFGMVDDETFDRVMSEIDAARVAVPSDGLAALISTILRKYGGTMKGRGDHDIYDALVRYRAALTPEATAPEDGS